MGVDEPRASCFGMIFASSGRVADRVPAVVVDAIGDVAVVTDSPKHARTTSGDWATGIQLRGTHGLATWFLSFEFFRGKWLGLLSDVNLLNDRQDDGRCKLVPQSKLEPGWWGPVGTRMLAGGGGARGTSPKGTDRERTAVARCCSLTSLLLILVDDRQRSTADPLAGIIRMVGLSDEEPSCGSRMRMVKTESAESERLASLDASHASSTSPPSNGEVTSPLSCVSDLDVTKVRRRSIRRGSPDLKRTGVDEYGSRMMFSDVPRDTWPCDVSGVSTEAGVVTAFEASL